MSTQAFISAVPVSLTHKTSSSPSVCTFLSRPLCVPRRAATTTPLFTMRSPASSSSDNSDYVIKQSEYVDPEGDDDSGDGFFGEKDMDDHLGIGMPEDLPSFDIRRINNARNRDELEDALRDVHSRRRDVYEDRRRGLGMDTADDYLKNL